MNSYKLDKGSTISIGKPAKVSEKMVEALTTFFEENDLVRGATLAWKARGNEVGYLLVIDSNEQPERIMPIIADICQLYLEDYPLDITYKSTALGEFVFDEVQPFYMKKDYK